MKNNPPCRYCKRPVEIYAWKVCERRDCKERRREIANKRARERARAKKLKYNLVDDSK